MQGSGSGGREEVCILGYNAMYPTESEPTFQKNISPPTSLLKKETCSYGTSVDLERNKRR
jgi:hypothetical protein